MFSGLNRFTIKPWRALHRRKENVLTEQKLREEIGAKKQEKAFQVPLEVPPSYVELIQNRVSSGKMVPRDRIELSTPAFSGLCSTN